MSQKQRLQFNVEKMFEIRECKNKPQNVYEILNRDSEVIEMKSILYKGK